MYNKKGNPKKDRSANPISHHYSLKGGNNLTMSSSPIFWILSPTYKYAERNKNLLLASDNGRKKVTKAIMKYNNRYLLLTLVLAAIAGFFFEQKLYQHESYKFINYGICIMFGWLVFVSRALEIFKAFLDDAVEKLNGLPSASDLLFGDRLRLAFKSYIELMVGFGVFYYILPSECFKGGNAPFCFSTIIESIYFSGITMATVGYGDISPANWFTQCLVVFQVFCGLTLALVSFTVYTSLALSNSKGENSRVASPNFKEPT